MPSAEKLAEGIHLFAGSPSLEVGLIHDYARAVLEAAAEVAEAHDVAAPDNKLAHRIADEIRKLKEEL